MANAYYLSGNIIQAIEQYEKVIELDSENPEGYYGIGKIYLEHELPEEAMNYLEKAENIYQIQSSPYIVDVQYLIGMAYFMLEDYSRTIEIFEQIYPELKKHPALNFYFGLSYLNSSAKDLEKAKHYIGIAEKLGFEVPLEVKAELNQQKFRAEN